MTFTAGVGLFVALIVLTAATALYRKLVSMRENDLIHIGAGEEKLISQQLDIAQKIALLDRVGETLTVITAAFGLILGVIYLYYKFNSYGAL